MKASVIERKTYAGAVRADPDIGEGLAAQLRGPQAILRDLFTFLGSALGYYLSAVVGTLLSVPPSGFAIIWPATAFLISIFLITPPNRWWLCIVGVVPMHFYLAATFQPHAALPVVLTQIGGNLLFSRVVPIQASRKLR